MINRPFTGIVVTCLCLAATVLPALGDDETKLGSRYRDPLNGFSLRPIEGTERQVKSATANVASWMKRDAKRGAIVWTFSVRKAAREVDPNETFDIKTYAKQLRKDAMQRERFRVDEVAFESVDEKPGIVLIGQSVGAMKFWQKEHWVRIKPGRWLVFTIFGSLQKERDLDQAMSTMMKTAKINDPAEEMKRRKEYLRNGKVVLLALTKEALAKAVKDKPVWRIMKVNDKPVGWMRQVEDIGREERMDGLSVVTHSWAKIPEVPLRVSEAKMFSSVGRTYSTWEEVLRVGEGRKRIVFREEGLQRDQVVMSSATKNGRDLPTTKRKDLPGSWFLPRAMEMILPRLVDLSKPGNYSFATYNSRTNKFDMRTFIVHKPTTIRIGDVKIEVVRCQDQSHWDKDPATLYLKPDGTLVRMESPGGFTVERSTRKEVVKTFRAAAGILRGLTD
ncbi:MAG: hypothetical protein ACLFTN_11795 [Phycisphaerae bacterium]